MAALTTKAPGKLNLCLYLGPTRADGLHELVSLFESVSLHDTVTMVDRPELETDRVICAGVEGENLAGQALAAARAADVFSGPSVEITIDKRIPVAAGMGGGSADAAATLRLVAARAGINPNELADLAFGLGADVPSQITPGAALVGGAGEDVEHVDISSDSPLNFVVVAQAQGLSTADVFRAADDNGLARAELTPSAAALRSAVEASSSPGDIAKLVENDLTTAIRALRPELSELPKRLMDSGAIAAEFTGSGPTCFGLYADRAAADRAAVDLSAEGLMAQAAESVGAEFANVQPLAAVTGS